MINETTILQERWIVWMGQDTNFCIRESEPAHKIFLQSPRDRRPEWFLYQATPGFARNIIGTKTTSKLIFRNQWLQHRVPYLLGKNAREIVKHCHLLEFSLIPSQLEHRLPTDFLVHVAQEQTIVLPMAEIRRKRRGGASAQFKIQTDVLNDFLWKQTDEIRISRQLCVIIGKHILRRR